MHFGSIVYNHIKHNLRKRDKDFIFIKESNGSIMWIQQYRISVFFGYYMFMDLVFLVDRVGILTTKSYPNTILKPPHSKKKRDTYRNNIKLETPYNYETEFFDLFHPESLIKFEYLINKIITIMRNRYRKRYGRIVQKEDNPPELNLLYDAKIEFNRRGINGNSSVTPFIIKEGDTS